MNLLIKLSPDITIKSDYVRKTMVKQLEQNIRTGLKKIMPAMNKKSLIPLSPGLEKKDFTLIRKFDRLELILATSVETKNFLSLQILQNTPGIAFFWERKTFPMGNFEEIFAIVKKEVGENFINKTFRATVKRSGNHAFTSMQLEKYLGGGIAQNIEGARVKLKNFEKELVIQVKDQEFSILTKRYKGVSGLPINSEKRVVSLISGGFDSGVSSFLMMRKGCPTDFLFFNLGGHDHKQGVKEVSKFMAEKFSHGYNPNMIVVPFEEVMKELIENVQTRYRTIVLKRCMMRAAEIIAKDFRYAAIVTGESIAQVSSQTITNLNVIEKSLEETPLFRPLLTHTKNDIIDIARKIGTDTFAAQMPEFCGVISKKPATGAKLAAIVEEEKNLSQGLIERAIAGKEVEKISEMMLAEEGEIQKTAIIQPNDIIIDLRQPEEIRQKTAPFPKNTVVEIPFYEINEKFSELDQSKNYTFFCSKGVMSKSHAQDLYQAGFKNIKIFAKGMKCEG